MLAELLAASTLLEAEVDEAKLTHDEARRRVRTLERMEAAHVEAELETELRVEQNRLDEIANGRRARGGEE
jgi:flagellar biosynthesis chaperone FliJ